jgi:predicted NUDIX family NTP pyrophosphohydrolase
MNVIYAKEPFPNRVVKTLFLAGPTPRDNPTLDTQSRSWFPSALALLRTMNYDGHIFVPEPRDGQWSIDYEDQVEWEEEGLHRADAIVFWFARNLQTLPGFTANDEWGAWRRSGKVFYGRPNSAELVRYQDHFALKQGINRFTALNTLLESALSYLGAGAQRVDGECTIPLDVWKQPVFQSWLSSQKKAGNRLIEARVKLLYPERNIEPKSLFGLYVRLWVEAESQICERQIALFCQDGVHIVLFKRGESALEHEVVLVRESRTSARTSDGFLHNVPGGGIDGREPVVAAIAEAQEETGVSLTRDRLRLVGVRQLFGKAITSHAHVFVSELTADEMAQVKARSNIAKGVESEGERTYTEVRTLHEVLTDNLVDWSQLGMILSVLSEV